MGDSPLLPVPPEARRLTGLDVAAVWFGAAIVISECWAGGLPPLTGLGLLGGLLAILLGRLFGNGLMGAMASIGARTGLPTMVLTRPAFGVRGSVLPAALNFVQLVGWTAWMYFVACLYLDRLAGAIGLPERADTPAMTFVWVGALALLCTACSFAGAETWHRLLKILALAMVLLTVWMTVLVFSRWSPAEVARRPAPGGTNLLLGVDVVVAMSVSWLPLVADYSRFAKSARGAALGTFGGYLLGGVWMYAVGLLIATATGNAEPDQIVVSTLSGAGIGAILLGILLVLVSTVTTTFLDVYSAAVSARSIAPRLPLGATILAVGLGPAALALLLDVFLYQHFLEAIGAVFIPVFAVVLTDHYVLARGRVDVAEIDRPGGAYWYRGGVRWRSFAAWGAGVATYFLAAGSALGASLPCLFAAAAVLLALHPGRTAAALRGARVAR